MAVFHAQAAPGSGTGRRGSLTVRPHAFPEDALSPDRLFKSRGAVWTAFVVAHGWITFMGVQLMFNTSFHDVEIAEARSGKGTPTSAVCAPTSGPCATFVSSVQTTSPAGRSAQK